MSSLARVIFALPAAAVFGFAARLGAALALGVDLVDLDDLLLVFVATSGPFPAGSTGRLVNASQRAGRRRRPASVAV